MNNNQLDDDIKKRIDAQKDLIHESEPVINHTQFIISLLMALLILGTIIYGFLNVLGLT
jgi:hypothetical protein